MVKIAVLFFFSFLVVGLALGYAYLDLKEIDGSVHDPNGAPIHQAALTLAGRSTLSDDAGRFHFQVARGTYDLYGFADGFAPAQETIVAEDLTQKEFTANLTLAPNVSTGVVTPAVARVTVVDEYTRAPLANVLVRAGEQSAQTDAQGQVVLRLLAKGSDISAQAPGYAAAQVQSNGQDVLTLALRPNILDGVVLDSVSHTPLAGALIFYNGQVLEADARGAYHLDNAPPELKLTVKTPGYRLTTFEVKRTARFDLALKPFAAKGIHIYYGMPRDAVLELLDRLRGTVMNAIVLDVKEGPGDIVWDSQVPLAKQLGAYKERGIPPREMIQQCRARALYCIARLVVFKDTRLATAHPAWALHFPNGALLDDGTARWLNPARQEVWEYAIALAKELSALGFDEVQFDYIRYPGRPVPRELGSTETRLETIRKFLMTASAALRPLPVLFSGDLFGLTVATDDEQGIGQRLEVDAPAFDYISPMLYPSTWKGAETLLRNGLNIPNCTQPLACPYELVLNGTKRAQARSQTRVRPWLQGYGDVGFGLRQYSAQKKGAEDAQSAGWLFWNNQGHYAVELFK